ncbi:unnamed protein product, partial [Discosporangium mesarthrocarpum]
LTKEERVSLITICVHGRDFVQILIDRRVENNLDFAWQSQLRYYFSQVRPNQGVREERNIIIIFICDFRSLYSFEYVGNCGRLVIRPLTDQCSCSGWLPRGLWHREDGNYEAPKV